MTPAAVADAPAERSPAGRQARRVSAGTVPVGLWVLAALISGFTIRRYLDPFDEGLLLQAAARVADGQWPYADFGWAYGPGQPLLVALALKAFGPSVLAWRIVRLAVDATVALLVFELVRREAGARWALAGWLAAALTIAQPTSANPFAPALAFALGAILAAARGRPVMAGLLVAGAGAWRPDLGLCALVAVVVAVTAAPGSPRRRPALTAGGVALAASAAVYAPFAVAAGLGRFWDALVGDALGDGAWWRLPFPLGYDGPLRGWPPADLAEDAKDALGHFLPLIAVVGLLAAALALTLRRRRPPPAVAGLTVLALGSLAYLASRPDELHVQPLLVCLCALAPLLAAAGGSRPASARSPALARAAAAVLVAVLALVLAAGAANRLSALLLPPELEPLRLAGVPGVGVPPDEARAVPAMVSLVQRLVPPGQPIYVAPRRSDLVTLSDPLVHFLVNRPNVVRRDVSLQARPREQAQIVAALRRARPLAIVRWTDPISARPEPNLRGRPSGSRALDEYLAGAYRLRGRSGFYDVLVPR